MMRMLGCLVAVRHLWLAVLTCGVLGLGSACSPPPPVRVAIMMPPMPNGQERKALQWAVRTVNAQGGIWGRTLIAEEAGIDPRLDLTQQQQRAAQLASDDSYVAVIGPGTSDLLAATADLFVEHKKPLVSFNSTAADILRAYGGKGWIWRTRESDISQAELMARYAAAGGAKRLSLVTPASLSGQTFLSWFAFFARDLGYPNDAIRIDILEPEAGCEAPMARALAFQPDMLFVVGATPIDYDCATRTARRPDAPSRPRLLWADTGLDTLGMLRALGPLAEGLEGFAPVSPGDGPQPGFEAAFTAEFGGETPPHGASEYDAILLLAYGLTRSRGEGGEALQQGIAAAIAGRGERTGWDGEGVRAALQALQQGGEPNVSGATGELDFEPGLLTDLADSTLAHWVVRQGQRRTTERFFTGESSFRTSQAALVRNTADSSMDLSGPGSGFVPAQPKRAVYALIAALSSGFPNYRHQADALRQYWLLRQAGVPDDHIVLMLADDIANARQNRRPGQVQNELAGPDLRAGAVPDYGLQLTAPELMDVLLGQASASTPAVLTPSADSNLYVYLVGHGGEGGLAIGATSASDGLAGRGSLLSPALLRETLCTLKSQGKLRRALVVIESCFGGVFGEASSGGLEAGCDDGSALSGAVLLSAANSDENSVATSYDSSLSAWLADEFSQRLARFAEASLRPSIVELYKTTYVAVPGSHVSIYNTGAAGQLSTVPLSEFLQP